MKSAVVLPISLIVFLSLSIFQSTSQHVPMKDRATRDIYYGTDNKANLDKNHNPISHAALRPGRQKNRNPSPVSYRGGILQTKEESSPEDHIANNTRSTTRHEEDMPGRYIKYPYSRSTGNTFTRDEITSSNYGYRTLTRNHPDNFMKHFEKSPDGDRAAAEFGGGRDPEREHFLEEAASRQVDTQHTRTSAHEIDNIRDYGNFRNSYGEYPIRNVWNFGSEPNIHFFNENTDFTKDFYQQSAIKIVDSPNFNTNFDSKPSSGNGFKAEMPRKYYISEWNEKIASSDFQYVPEIDIKGYPISSSPTAQILTGNWPKGGEDVNSKKGFHDYSRLSAILPAVPPMSSYASVYSSAYKNNDFFGLEDVSKNYNYPTLSNTLQFPRAEPTIGVPQTIIVPVPQPYPVKVPVTKPVAIPIIKEIKVPVEKKVPYPVYKNIPYPVEKRVPVPVEKHVTVPVLRPFPVKIPIIKSVYHHSHEDSGDVDSEIWDDEETSWKPKQKRPHKNFHDFTPCKTERPKKKPHRESWLKDQPVNYEEELWGDNTGRETWESTQPPAQRGNSWKSRDRERRRKNLNRGSRENGRPGESQHREPSDGDELREWDNTRHLNHNRYRETSKKYPKRKSPRGRARTRGGGKSRG